MARHWTTRLRDRRVLSGVVVILCGLGVTFAWRARPTDDLPTAAQVMAPDSSESAEIVIGPNVQVSAGHGTAPHREITAVADPADPRRLFAAAILHPSGDTSAMAVVG